MCTSNEDESVISYRKFAKKAAKELKYPETVVKAIALAKTIAQIERIMCSARQKCV